MEASPVIPIMPTPNPSGAGKVNFAGTDPSTGEVLAGETGPTGVSSSSPLGGKEFPELLLDPQLGNVPLGEAAVPAAKPQLSAPNPNIKAFSSIVGKGQAVIDRSQVLALLTGNMESLRGVALPALITESLFIRQAMADGIVAFMSTPYSLGDLAEMLDIQGKAGDRLPEQGLNLEQKVTPNEFLKGLGVDPQTIVAELTRLRDHLLHNGGATLPPSLPKPKEGARKADDRTPSQGVPAALPQSKGKNALGPEVDQVSADLASLAAAAQGPVLNPSAGSGLAKQDSIPKIPQSYAVARDSGVRVGKSPNPFIGSGDLDPQTAEALLIKPEGSFLPIPDSRDLESTLDSPLANMQQGDPRSRIDFNVVPKNVFPVHSVVAPASLVLAGDRRTQITSTPSAAMKEVQSLLGRPGLEVMRFEAHGMIVAGTAGKRAPDLHGLVDTASLSESLRGFKPDVSALQLALSPTQSDLAPQPEAVERSIGGERTGEDTGITRIEGMKGVEVVEGMKGAEADLRRPQAEPALASQELPPLVESIEKSVRQFASDLSNTADEQGGNKGDGPLKKAKDTKISKVSTEATPTPELKGMRELLADHGLSHGKSGELPATSTLPKLVDKSKMLLSAGGGTAVVDLKDEGLGNVSLAVKLSGNDVSVKILTETDRARDILGNDVSSLKQSLGSQNLKLVHVETQSRGFSEFASFGRDAYEQRQQFLEKSLKEKFGGVSGLAEVESTDRSILRNVVSYRPQSLFSDRQLIHVRV